jgi:hypothetical protein
MGEGWKRAIKAAKATRVRKPRLCEECGKNPADTPSKICVGCQAYREHTGHF